MLTSTFIHAPRVGAATERSLWEQGAVDWDSFLANLPQVRLPKPQLGALTETVQQSVSALAEGRVEYFASALPKREHWRAFSAFPKIGFLDIETDGTMRNDAITMIGLCDGVDTSIYVKHHNLAQFAYECQDFDGFVTFFGTGFDLPMLCRKFPVLEGVFADRIHVDLCPLLKRLGYSGGLKLIEHQVGIKRGPLTAGLNGMDAVRLWRAYRMGGAGSDEAISLLAAYNKEDVVNLKTLLEFALPRIEAITRNPTQEDIVTQKSQAARYWSRGATLRRT